MSSARKPLLWAILLGMVCLATLILIEVAARMVYGENRFTIHKDSMVFQHDPLLGWKGIPGYQGIPRQEYGAEVSINSHGFRDSDWNEKLRIAADTGRKKMLFLGDSVLYGARVDTKDRITEQLASIYRKNLQQEIIFFNAGIPGFGTGQEYRALQDILPMVEPDVVVLRFTPNDIGDSSLPYDHRYSRRVYKPFYSYEGELVLNETVPMRFSHAVRDTPLAALRSRFLIDDLQKIIDNVGYKKYDLPERRLVYPTDPIPRRWPGYNNRFGFDSVFGLYQYNKLYKKNSVRNINLFRRMRDIAAESGARFIVMVDMSTGDDATFVERDFLTRLEDSGIEASNTHDMLGRFRPWSYVNYDGHPNFLKNYIGALGLFNRLEKAQLELDFRTAPWYPEIPTNLDFSQGKFDRVLFGHWHPIEKGDPTGYRWMGDSAYLLLRAPAEEHVRITARGESRFVGRNTSNYNLGAWGGNVITALDRGGVLGQATIPDRGPFSVQFTHRVAQDGLLFLNIISSRSFRPYIAGIGPDERQMSVLISTIAVEPK